MGGSEVLEGVSETELPLLSGAFETARAVWLSGHSALPEQGWSQGSWARSLWVVFVKVVFAVRQEEITESKNNCGWERQSGGL